MTIEEKIRKEKLQSDINREAGKISALSSSKIHKQEYLTGEDILPSSNQQIIEEARFTYSPLGKVFDKQIKTIEDQGKKLLDALNTLKSDNNNNKKLENKNEDIIPKNAFASDEAREEINKILKIERNVDREHLIYDAGKYTYDFRILNLIRTFGEDIYNGKITLEEADKDQSNLADEINDFIKTTKPRNNEKKQEKKIVTKNLRNFLNAREMVLNGFKSKIFLTKSIGTGILNTDNSKLKILTPKQMFQRLPIALAQVKAGNNSEKLLNEIRQILYSLYQAKEITKKAYNNLMKSL